MSEPRRQVCVGCSVEKAHTLHNFYACKTGRHGLRIKCKVCVRADVCENRALKIEQRRAYCRQRNREPYRAAYKRAWKQSPTGRASNRLTNRMYTAFKTAEVRA